MTHLNYPLGGLRRRDEAPIVRTGPKAQDFVRQAIALAIAHGSHAKAAEIASERWGPNSRPARLLTRATVAGGTTVPGAGWGDELLADAGQTTSEFFGVVDARSIIGRIPNLRRIPPRVRIIRGDGVSSAWYGEGIGKGLSLIAYQRTLPLPLLKLATMVVVTDEMLRDTSPAAESLIREEMIRAQTVAMDDAFINPANAGQWNESGDPIKPPSILSGAPQAMSSSPSAGVDADDHLESLLDNFSGSLEDAVFIMEPKLAARLTSAARPNVGARGGQWAGIPVVTSSTVPNGIIALVDPTGIALVMPDDSSEIRVSTQASISMLDVPSQYSGREAEGDSPPGVGLDEMPRASSAVSLFQTNSVAILAERFANWRVVRPGSVTYISGVSF